MIRYITPGHSDMNLGREINDYVKRCDDNDWLCLRDIDTMPAYHEVFFKQCEDISRTNFGLVGCMTNRLGLKYQLHGGEISNNTDWIHHRNIAKRRYTEFGSMVEVTENTVAGIMMLFPKRVWVDVGGFPDGLYVKGGFIDYHFSKAVMEKGYKCGIALGVYVIHQYRPDAPNPKSAVGHLIKSNPPKR